MTQLDLCAAPPPDTGEWSVEVWPGDGCGFRTEYRGPDERTARERFAVAAPPVSLRRWLAARVYIVRGTNP